jgi:ABC-type antimicrobial peptide transport system permease subunit
VQALTDIHLYSHFTQDVEGQGNITHVRAFLLIALFILIIACINFMNLATALSGSRATEIGLRKAIGAVRIQLIIQLLSESLLLAFIALLLAFIALLLAVCLAYLALPFFNTLTAKTITFSLFDTSLLWKLLGITLLTGLSAGSYPAIYMSSFNAVKALKGGQLLKGKDTFLRNGLVVLQFSVSAILIISTVIVYRQLNFVRHHDIGFKKENLLYVPIPAGQNAQSHTDALKIAVSRSADISDLTVISDLPTDLNAGAPLTWRGMDKSLLVIIQRLTADAHFINTFGMKIVAGRFYSGDVKENDSEYVVNETAVRAMQLTPDNAIGKMITVRGREGAIVGVVKDFNFKPLYQPVEPLIIRRGYEDNFLVIRTPAGDVKTTLEKIQKCFLDVYGNMPFDYGFIDQDIDNLYKAEFRTGILFKIFAVLSIIISCLGLLGLATFTTRKRTREIGIRKVLGADEAGIVLLLSKNFLKLVIVALLIAFPIAWYLMQQWLQHFTYRINISVWIFAATGIGVLLLAFLSVGYQTIKAALANPVRSLKNE